MRPKPDHLDPAGKPVYMNGTPGPGDVTLMTANARTNPQLWVKFNTAENNSDVIGSYQELYEAARHTSDVLAYIHDDVIVRERGWDERVLREFEDREVGLVGFGGAKQHGSDDLYKTPYQLTQLARYGYLSNVDDAESHGGRFTESTDSAVLDGFSLIARRDLLDRCGGWPIRRYPPMHLY